MLLTSDNDTLVFIVLRTLVVDRSCVKSKTVYILVALVSEFSAGKLSYSYDPHGGTQTRECEICIDPDPQNTFSVVVQNFIYVC